jgi:predicted PurR-regulated permease PerM
MVILASIVLLVVAIKSELANVQLNIPDYAKRLYDLVPANLKVQLNIDTHEKISQQLNQLAITSRSMAFDIAKPVLAWLQQALTSTVGFILNLLGYLIIPIYLFYLLVDMPLLVAWIKELPPERFRAQLEILATEINTVLSGFIRGQLLVCAILAVLYSIGLWIIGIDLAVAIGTLAGAAFIIPYVGTVIGIVLSMLMALLKFHDLLHPMLCLGWFLIVQALEGMYITPKVVGDTVGLHPLIAIIALLIGGQLMGISGMLLAIPMAAVAKVFACRLLDYYRNSEFYQGA